MPKTHPKTHPKTYPKSSTKETNFDAVNALKWI
jgi:hypothetical protein